MSECRASRHQDLLDREYSPDASKRLSFGEYVELEYLEARDDLDKLRFAIFWPVILCWRSWKLKRRLS